MEEIKDSINTSVEEEDRYPQWKTMFLTKFKICAQSSFLHVFLVFSFELYGEMGLWLMSGRKKI
jgi:hypothetical protein